MKKIPSINKKLKALRKDLEWLKKTSATKRGLGAFSKSTKRDIENSRQDLDGKFKRMAVEFVRNTQDIRELKALVPVLSEVRENFWQLLNRFDSLDRKIEATKKA